MINPDSIMHEKNKEYNKNGHIFLIIRTEF